MLNGTEPGRSLPVTLGGLRAGHSSFFTVRFMIGRMH
jgi:hypothetical protein